MVCWHCKNANIELAKQFYNSKLPKRPLCAMIALSKHCFSCNGIDYDTPDPSEPIGKYGCEFQELGYDIREKR